MKNLVLTLLGFIPFLVFGQTSLKVTDNGDVGIGTATPSSKLEVKGMVKSLGNTVQRNGLSGSSLYERTNNAVMLVGAGLQAGFSIDQDYNFEIRSNVRANVLQRRLSEGMIIMRGIGSTGYIGFGVANPSEKIHVGGNIFATGTITPSDRRLKHNVTDFTDGLSVIKNLNTIRYQYNGKAGLETEEFHIGVYAQELQEEAPYLVEEFLHQEENYDGEVIVEETYLKIRDSEIKYLLLNAVKEQQEIIEDQQTVIEDMQKELQAIKEMLRGDKSGKMEGNSQDILLEGKGRLMQNSPNPFSKNTVIQYEVKEVNANAEIQVFSLSGKLMKVVNIDGQTGQINLEVNDLASGTYSYSLVIDNQIVDTKKMVLSK